MINSLTFIWGGGGRVKASALECHSPPSPSSTIANLQKYLSLEMGGCRPSWLPYGQDCFQFNTNRSFYSNAKRDCETKGGNLAVIPTSLQQAFLSMVIRTVNADSYIGKGVSNSSILGYLIKRGLSTVERGEGEVKFFNL